MVKLGKWTLFVHSVHINRILPVYQYDSIARCSTNCYANYKLYTLVIQYRIVL